MIFVLGTTTVDFMIAGLDRLPSGGGDEFTTSNLIYADEPLRISLGGNGANSAYALGRLGAATTLASARGDDVAGGLVLDWLRGAGVDLTGLFTHPQAATATTTVIMDAQRNRQSFYHPGALHAFGPEQIPFNRAEAAQAVLISGYSLLPSFRPEGYRRLLRKAQQGGALTFLDIGPAIGEPPIVGELEPLLQDLDFLLANQHEIQVLAGSDSPAAAIEGTLAAGVRNLVLKRGAQGAALYRSGADPLHVPAYEVKTMATVGAGDAFNSGFLAATLAGSPPKEALRFGCAVAALVVSSEQGILGSPARAQVDRLMATASRTEVSERKTQG